jgi:hypothetical protein
LGEFFLVRDANADSPANAAKISESLILAELNVRELNRRLEMHRSCAPEDEPKTEVKDK